MLNTFTNHLNLSNTEVDNLLALSLQQLLNSPDLQQKLAGLDIKLLKQTLPTAGTILAINLPPFYNWLKYDLGLERVPDSPDHTTKWVINFLNNQESLMRLVDLHRSVPRPALEQSIPRLMGLFDTIEDTQTRREWQSAIASFCLVLAVAARHEPKAIVSSFS
jgi:hypothetical protein